MNISLYLSFFAGIVSILSPCILPVIPLVVAFSIKKKTIPEILLFIFGLLSIFLLVIALTAIFTVAINKYLFYFRIVSSIILIVLGLFILFDRKIFNYSISFKNQETKKDTSEKSKNELLSALSFGFLTSLAWAPCYTSYLLAVISYASSKGDVLFSVSNVLSYSLGFALTLFVLALFINKINLEKFLKYNKALHVISSLLIIFAGIYMFFIIL